MREECAKEFGRLAEQAYLESQGRAVIVSAEDEGEGISVNCVSYMPPDAMIGLLWLAGNPEKSSEYKPKSERVVN